MQLVGEREEVEEDEQVKWRQMIGRGRTVHKMAREGEGERGEGGCGRNYM